MRTRHTIPAALAAALLLTATACSTESKPEPTKTIKPPPTATPSAKEPSAEDLAKAREKAGLPPKPDATVAAAYIAALNAIDPRIVKPGKEDQAISRGLNQCRSIKSVKDKSTLPQQALGRFTVDTRLPDIATHTTGTAILAAVHKNLCPTF
ncbi:hypothetical protein ABZ714_19555 [Streptomyces sp. NPDC006798]|uniref:hypothetical protein n=1 Tax=Streptomyces sp. NPDC006798 TaxID=3155462 RepID=UPI0033CA4E13